MYALGHTGLTGKRNAHQVPHLSSRGNSTHDNT
jgi:hypothetical protein